VSSLLRLVQDWNCRYSQYKDGTNKDLDALTTGDLEDWYVGNGRRRK
jgi:hypothetical protein